MSLAVKYENVEEAEFRLHNTVVMYDGEPVYIDRVTSAAPGDPNEDIFRVYATPLPLTNKDRGSEQFRRFISSKKFDLSTVKMGFYNSKAGPLYYCTREPRRQTKQGLSSQTFNAVALTAAPEALVQPRGNGVFNSALNDQAFVDMIKGVYPNFGDAMNILLDGNRLGTAFAREFAVVKDNDLDNLIYLYYKTTKVGFILDNKITLSTNMKCLRESLVELGLRV